MKVCQMITQTLFLVFCLIQLTQSARVTQIFGVSDFFVDTEATREFVPQSPKLTTCSSLNWLTDDGLGDNKPIGDPWFDRSSTNLALAWTVSNLPEDLSTVHMKFMFTGTGDIASNDCFGFFWDDGIPDGGGECQASGWLEFRMLDALKEYDNDKIFNLTLLIDDNLKLPNSEETVVGKMRRLGYFHFFVGDDTTVDYFQISYETDYKVDDLVSFTCHNYESLTTLTPGETVYTDSEKTIETILDSVEKPFEDSNFISPYEGDKGQTESVFKVQISGATRFWVFVKDSDTPLSWLEEGGWKEIDGSVTLSDGSTFVVYVKRYDGPRWVTFGPPSNEEGESEGMYFVGYAPTTATIKAPSNQAAACDCQSTGDPHYITWDNRKFDFYEDGTFHLVKARDCSFDIQTTMFKYGRTSVNGIVSVRYEDDVVVLSRTPGTPGQLWTGNPVAYVNGDETGESTSAGGLSLTKLSDKNWQVSIPTVGLNLRAISDSHWFHIYVSLSDIGYQRKVDGLCGNCDGNGSNDFKYPNCDQAITDTSSNLQYQYTIQWGVSWEVNKGEDIGLSNVTDPDAGSSSWETCKASPIRQQCPDLVLPEVPDTETPIVEPLPPTDFFACDGDTVITIVDNPPPDVDVPTDVPPQVCDDDKYEGIVAKCQECAKTNHYPVDDCITDLCESGQDVGTFVCPGDNQCVSTDKPTSTTTTDNYEWAILGGGEIEGIAAEDFCEDVRYLPPNGWEVALDTEEARQVISEHPWETVCVAVVDGSSYPSKSCKNQEGKCPTSGSIVKTSDGCYTSNNCNTRILIRRPLNPECGNGVVEEGEKCDDANTQDGDGCSSTCTEEPTHYCIPTVPSQCDSITDVVEEKLHNCPYDLPGCEPCVLTDENRDYEYCCDCDNSCCD